MKFKNYYKDDNTYNDIEISYPYKTKNKIIVFGGHDTWVKEIKQRLPNVKFIPTNSNPTKSSIKNKDEIWIQYNCISHSYCGKIIKTAKTYNIPINYFQYASAEKCANQLILNNIKKENKNEI